MDTAASDAFQPAFNGLSGANIAVLLPYRNLIIAPDLANRLV